MNAADKQMQSKVKKLCAKFRDELQELFDSDAMNETVYDGEVCQSAVMAQSYAEDAANVGGAA